MVISGVNTVTYNGDSITTAWPYTFPVTDDSEIRVQLNNADGTAVIIESDYYVDLVNSTVYYPGYAPGAEPPEAEQPPKVQEGQTITVYREIPMTQEADLGEKWPFAVIEKGLDKLTMIAQQIDSGTKRILDNALASMGLLADVVVDSDKLQHITDQLNTIDEKTEDAAESEANAATSAANAAISAANASTNATNAYNSANNANSTATALTDFLADKTTLTAPAVDATLSVSGAAADAKVTGHRLLDATEPYINLFDRHNRKDLDAYIGATLVANATAKTIYVPCKPSTTYTVTKILTARFAVGYTDTTPAIGVAVSGTVPHADYTSITITTSASATYLVVFLYNSSLDTVTYSAVCNSLQIEEGDMATPYHDFVYNAIDLVSRNSIFNLDFLGDKNVLSASDDLDNIEDSVWVAPTTAIAQTILHSPSSVPFKVISFKLYNTMQVQFIVDVGDRLFYRTENSQGEFTDWRLCSDLLPLLTLRSTTQIATYGTDLAPALSTLTATGTATYDTDRWTFTAGGTLSTTITVEADATYLISLSAENVVIVNGDISLVPITISLGSKDISIYAGGDANWNVALTPTASGSAQLTISAPTDWAGDITNLSVKKITNNATSPLNMNSLPVNVYNSNLSFGGQGKILYNTARTDSNIGGRQNTSFGWNTQRDIDTGKWNSAFGFNAQQRMTQGVGNSAYGSQSQYYITTGSYNNAFGEASQGYMTTGMWNDAHGIEAQCYTATGKNNVAMGRRSQHLLTSGDFNTAIGAWAGFNSHDQSPEGVNSVRTSNYTTLIGGAATLKSPDAGDSDYATSLGYQTKADKQGLALGALSTAGENGIAIGYSVNADNNTIVVGNNQNSVIIAGKQIVFNNDGTITWTTP